MIVGELYFKKSASADEPEQIGPRWGRKVRHGRRSSRAKEGEGGIIHFVDDLFLVCPLLALFCGSLILPGLQLVLPPC